MTQQYPKVMEAVFFLFNDQGMEHDPKLKLPATVDWQIVEDFLNTLTEEEFETLVIGDQTEMLAIARRSKDSAYAHVAIGTLFEMIGG